MHDDDRNRRMVTNDGGSAVVGLSRCCSRSRWWARRCSYCSHDDGVMQECTRVVSSDRGHCEAGIQHRILGTINSNAILMN